MVVLCLIALLLSSDISFVSHRTIHYEFSPEFSRESENAYEWNSIFASVEVFKMECAE